MDGAKKQAETEGGQKMTQQERQAKYYRKHRERILARQRASHPVSRKTARKAYKLRYPDKHRAHVRVNDAVIRGALIKSSYCQLCWEPSITEGHHYLGYSYAHALDVVWLCIPCHRQIEGRWVPAEKRVKL